MVEKSPAQSLRKQIRNWVTNCRLFAGCLFVCLLVCLLVGIRMRFDRPDEAAAGTPGLGGAVGNPVGVAVGATVGADVEAHAAPQRPGRM